MNVAPESSDLDYNMGDGGDFTLAAGQTWFGDQHHAQILAHDDFDRPSEILVLDNTGAFDDATQEGDSRILKIGLTYDAGGVPESAEYREEVSLGLSCSFLGSVYVLADTGHLLADCGPEGTVREVDWDGNVYWEMQVISPTDSATAAPIYRAIPMEEFFPQDE